MSQKQTLSMAVSVREGLHIHVFVKMKCIFVSMSRAACITIAFWCGREMSQKPSLFSLREFSKDFPAQQTKQKVSKSNSLQGS